MGATRIFNQQGDVTIGWTAEEDERMAALIQRKLDQGVAIFIVRPFTDQGTPIRQQITKREDITGREIVIGDVDFDEMFRTGGIGIIGRIRSGLEIVRRTFSAHEAARSHTVMMRQLGGG
jgi:hypothetical protein